MIGLGLACGALVAALSSTSSAASVARVYAGPPALYVSMPAPPAGTPGREDIILGNRITARQNLQGIDAYLDALQSRGNAAEIQKWTDIRAKIQAEMDEYEKDMSEGDRVAGVQMRYKKNEDGSSTTTYNITYGDGRTETKVENYTPPANR
jgi:hypothetical protein